MSFQHSVGGISTAAGSVLVFDHIETNGQMWVGTGERRATAKVKFEAAFDRAPHVLLSISMIDADNGSNLRLQLSAENVTRTGFMAIAYTWKDTRIGRLSVSWIAMGKFGSEWDV